MKNCMLLRRQHIWLPTLLGWIVLLAMGATACAIGARYIYAFLAPSDPAPHAQILVVEGWISKEELDQAAAAFNAGKYARIVTTGGPVDSWHNAHYGSNFAESAADYLRMHDPKLANVVPIPAPASAQDRTYLSAVMVREWVAKSGVQVTEIDVFSSGPHARRSRLLYRLAFGPNVRVGVLAARSPEIEEPRWWGTSSGAKAVIGETIGLLWAACCFHPDPPGSREEMWGPLPHKR
jgi:hypothetical protein